MALILRVDVDKPFGRSNIFRKVASKLAEDYWFPVFSSFGYLTHLQIFLEYCNSKNISGFIYHRTCTIPDEKIQKSLIKGNHKIGFHAENTRTFETFSNEINHFKNLLNPIQIESFTKHGSGMLKLGKNHYPPYEPEKYFEWAKKLNIDFFFGNGICSSSSNLLSSNNFFPNMFWIEREYRHPDFFEFKKLLEVAKNKDVVVLIHPCNFHASKIVLEDFETLVNLSKEQSINWKTF